MKTFSGKRGSWTVEHVHRWAEREPLPTFQSVELFDKSTRISTIGSCFAANVAKVLSGRGFRVDMHPAGLWYNTFSIEQEFRHMFDPSSSSYDREELWQTNDGRWIHPFKAYDQSFPSKDELREWSNNIDADARAQFLGADLIIVTLGLTEVWQSALGTGNTYIQIPPPDIHKKNTAMFRVSTVAENFSNIEKIYHLIRKHTHADLILTVSPVPLSATFTNLDVRVANNISKSTLCAAVAEFIRSHPDVYYFHSYEIVSSIDYPMRIMEKDGRHVHEVGVELIMNEFVKCYGKDAVKSGVSKSQDLLIARLQFDLRRSLTRSMRKLQQRLMLR